MTVRFKKTLCIILALLCAAALMSACASSEPEPSPTPQPTPEPTPTPIPTPTPSPEPELFPHEAVTFDGIELEEGSFTDAEGLIYADFENICAALELETSMDRDFIVFTWRKQEINIRQDEDVLTVNRQRFPLGGPVISVGGRLYVPVEGFCEALKISLYYDAEYKHLYCTPGAGDWQVKDGYKIPVFMYHAVAQPWAGDPALDVWPSDVEKQLQYLQDNGYETIFFEDIAHIEDYEKPVILTFDDGYLNNYDTLFPILQRFNAKATFFIVSGYMEKPGAQFMNAEQVREVSQSGLVDIQSHTAHHHFLHWRAEDALHVELSDSKLALTRITGKEPYVLCYPAGHENSHVREVATEEYNYNFGLKMTGDVYVTGDDPMLIYRYYVIRELDMDIFAQMLEAEPKD